MRFEVVSKPHVKQTFWDYNYLKAANTHYLAAFFILNQLNMSKITRQKRKDNFTVVNNEILQNPGLSWAAKGMLVYLLHLPDEWQINIADLSNRSKNGRDGTASVIKELMNSGYVTRQRSLTESKKFAGYDYTVNDEPVNVKTVNGISVNGKSVTSNNYLNKELKEVRTNQESRSEKLIKEELNAIKEEYKNLPDLGTQEVFEKLKQLDAEIKASKLKIVSEVIDYLNTQAKTSFKATTKETMQFVLARQKVDGWELEDFKLVIDFKVNDWGKDDRMKQYICPSTLFRASNAEKYMQAAKAWKESCKVGQNGKIKPGQVLLFRQEAFLNPDKSKFKF